MQGLAALRLVRPQFARTFATSSAALKEKLVIVGSGWGGYSALAKVNRDLYDISVVSPDNIFNFTPLLAGASAATIGFDATYETVKNYPEVNAVQAAVTNVDLEKKIITAEPTVQDTKHRFERSAEVYPSGLLKPFELPYDKLLLAYGCRAQTFGTPGVEEYGNFLRTVSDARKIRARVLELFELASLPTATEAEKRGLLHFVLVGGGPIGIESCGELTDALKGDLAKQYPDLAKYVSVTVYDVAPTILPMFTNELKQVAIKQLESKGVSFKLSHHVKKVGPLSLTTEEEGEVPYGLIIWGTGIRNVPLAETFKGLKQDARSKNFIVTDSLNVQKEDGTPLKDVFAVGDIAWFEWGRLPPTAQVASQEGFFAARALNTIGRGRSFNKKFSFSNKGILTYIGDWKALFDRSGAESGPKLKGAGHFPWVLWRSTYLAKSYTWRNSTRLFLDWAFSAIFGRKFSRF